MASNDQVGKSDTVAGGKQGVAAGLVNEQVDELLPLEVLPRFAERCALRRIWERDEFIVAAACARSHGVKPIHL